MEMEVWGGEVKRTKTEKCKSRKRPELQFMDMTAEVPCDGGALEETGEGKKMKTGASCVMCEGPRVGGKTTTAKGSVQLKRRESSHNAVLM